MKGKVNRAEAHQSEGGLIPLCHFTLEWLRRNSALIPRSLLRGALFNFQYMRHLICAHYERTLINPHVLQINNHVKRFVEFQTSLFIYENGLYTLNKGKLHES